MIYYQSSCLVDQYIDEKDFLNLKVRLHCDNVVMALYDILTLIVSCTTVHLIYLRVSRRLILLR